MYRLLALHILLVISASVYSQQLVTETVSSGGNSFISSDVKIDYTVGEVFMTTVSNGEVVTQGLQQALVTQETLTVGETEYVMSAFPNPTHDFLYLSFSESPLQNMNIHLYDMSGINIPVQIHKNNDKYTIDMSVCVSGTYTLEIKFDNEFAKKSQVSIIKL